MTSVPYAFRAKSASSSINVYDANGQYLGLFIGLERTHAGDDHPSTRIYLTEVYSIFE